MRPVKWEETRRIGVLETQGGQCFRRREQAVVSNCCKAGREGHGGVTASDLDVRGTG